MNRRVLSYNIHHAEGIDGKLDVARIARVIKDCQPDLVALQEVDKLVERTESIDQPTIPVTTPDRQIDFVLFRPAARWKVVKSRVLEEMIASDHRPILAVLELLTEALENPEPVGSCVAMTKNLGCSPYPRTKH